MLSNSDLGGKASDEKVFVIYVEQSVGLAIALFKQGTQKERPLTHDLLANILGALEAKIERVIVTGNATAITSV